MLSQASALKSALQSTFTLHQLQQQIGATFPQADVTQLVQDLSVIGMLYKLPQGVSTPMGLQQEPLYAFRTHPSINRLRRFFRQIRAPNANVNDIYPERLCLGIHFVSNLSHNFGTLRRQNRFHVVLPQNVA